MRSPTHPSLDVESGLILLDSSCGIIAIDRGAAAMLNYSRGRIGESPGMVDKNVIETVQSLSDPSRPERVVRIGLQEFTCRTYILENPDISLSTEPLVALLLERHWKGRDAIDEICAQYHLTRREQEALRGLALGLSTKALAETMHIKPSTLRACLRLIKIKMGVPTRAEIMVKILQRKS